MNQQTATNAKPAEEKSAGTTSCFALATGATVLLGALLVVLWFIWDAPFLSAYYDQQGQVYYGTNNAELAIANYNKVINLDSNNLIVYMRRGLAYDLKDNHLLAMKTTTGQYNFNPGKTMPPRITTTIWLTSRRQSTIRRSLISQPRSSLNLISPMRLLCPRGNLQSNESNRPGEDRL